MRMLDFKSIGGFIGYLRQMKPTVLDAFTQKVIATSKQLAATSNTTDRDGALREMFAVDGAGSIPLSFAESKDRRLGYWDLLEVAEGNNIKLEALRDELLSYDRKQVGQKTNSDVDFIYDKTASGPKFTLTVNKARSVVDDPSIEIYNLTCKQGSNSKTFVINKNLALGKIITTMLKFALFEFDKY